MVIIIGHRPVSTSPVVGWRKETHKNTHVVVRRTQTSFTSIFFFLPPPDRRVPLFFPIAPAKKRLSFTSNTINIIGVLSNILNSMLSLNDYHLYISIITVIIYYSLTTRISPVSDGSLRAGYGNIIFLHCTASIAHSTQRLYKRRLSLRASRPSCERRARYSTSSARRYNDASESRAQRPRPPWVPRPGNRMRRNPTRNP